VAFSPRIAPIVEKTVKLNADGAELVDISAPVTEELLAALRDAGATSILVLPIERLVA